MSLLSDMKDSLNTAGITNVFPLRIPEDATGTTITLNVISELPKHNLNETLLHVSRVQISVFADRYETGRTTAEAIRTALNHNTFSWGTVLLNNITDSYTTPQDGSDNPTYQVNSDYFVLHSVA